MRRKQLNNGPYSINYIAELTPEELAKWEKGEITSSDILTACDNRTEPTAPGERPYFGGTVDHVINGRFNVKVYID